MRCVTTMETKDFTKKIWAFTLGDGGLSSTQSYYLVDERKHERSWYNREKNSHYYLKQREDHLDYIEWQANYLEQLTSIRISHNDAYIDKRGFNIKGQYELHTKTHPIYTTMRNRIYLNNTKCISEHDLHLLDWECMAIFYMDDGWLETQERQTTETYVRIGIASHNFTYGDQLMLKAAIKEKLGIEFNIRKHLQKSGEYKYFLSAKKEHARRFLDGISRFILPSYEYKLFSEQVAPAMGGDIV